MTKTVSNQNKNNEKVLQVVFKRKLMKFVLIKAC